MDWITTEYVAEQAKLGEIPALECSLLHHQQGRDAEKVELIDAILESDFNVFGEFCACCVLRNGKGDCALQGKLCNDEYCCGGNWIEVKRAFIDLKYDYSNANFKAFQEAEAKVCAYIERVLEQKRAEKKKVSICDSCIHGEGKQPCIYLGGKVERCNDFMSKSAPKLRHGDYGESPADDWVCWQGKVFYGRSGGLSGLDDQYFLERRLGNIFGDLEAKRRQKK